MSNCELGRVACKVAIGIAPEVRRGRIIALGGGVKDSKNRVMVGT